MEKGGGGGEGFVLLWKLGKWFVPPAWQGLLSREPMVISNVVLK